MAVGALTRRRVALLLSARYAYGRDIIAGVSDYIQSSRSNWELLLHEDFRGGIKGIAGWNGDGVIADFDDPTCVDVLAGIALPVVGVGGSYHREADYPRGAPYVATDNEKLVETAYAHLVEMGLRHFALYSVPPAPTCRWAGEREAAFRSVLARDGLKGRVFQGVSSDGANWSAVLSELTGWLQSLPKPVGVIAVTETRARQVLHACLDGDIAVPEAVAIIGIDDDPLLRSLSRLPISAVQQGTRQMGYLAAELLHRRMIGDVPATARILVPPVGVNAQASSRFQPIHDPVVMRGRHFIRQFAAQGVKVAQVAAYVGVSRTTLEARFRAAVGRSVHMEILRHKIDLAVQLLTEDLSCEAVAQRAGFVSSQYMHNVFRRELGKTPRQVKAEASP